ncbi:O-antigen polymerase [Psychrobacter sp. GP33]|uniref:O-antigen polymerase n=1 Tax=Psychrobacter sp. GP33 TaxID=2758709 RepID=UPI0015FCF1D4|nr:O-antigen polymerase [Psychrobacter sp. GP33]
MIDKFLYILFFIILVALKPNRLEDFSQSLNFTYSIIYLILLIVFLLHHRKIDKNWMRFDVIFLVGYSIVHLQIPFLASIGTEPFRPYFIWINKDVVNYATWMSVVAIDLWMLGYSLALNNSLKKTTVIKKSKKNIPLIDTLLLIMFLGFLATVGAVFLRGVYDVESWGQSAVYFLLLLETLIYIRIVYFFEDMPQSVTVKRIVKKLINNKIFATVLILYFILFFLSGSRGEILRIILLTTFCYSLYIKKLSLKYIVLGILIGSLVFTLIGMGRVNDISKQDNEGIFTRGYSALVEKDDEEQANFTNELASSVRIQYRALDTMPEKQDYLYGKTYVIGLFAVIPFASGLVSKTFDVDKQYIGSSNYFTYLGQGINPSYGEGSEILGDIYINFSIYGVFIIMFGFGMVSSKFYSRAKILDTKYVLLYSILLISALGLNRASLFVLYKNMFYILLFHFIFSMRKR